MRPRASGCAHARARTRLHSRARPYARTPSKLLGARTRAPAHPRMATQLKDDRTVSDYKIGMESTIFLVDYTPS